MEALITILDITIWPITVLVISLIFKTETKKLITRLTSLKFKGVEANFTNELKQIEKDAQKIKSNKESVSVTSIKEIENRLDRLVDISPKAAILEAWSEIEGLGYKVGLTRGTVMPRVFPKAIVEYLESTGEFSPLEIKLIEDLRRLRNSVSHIPDVEISTIDAERFMNISKKVISLLDTKVIKKHE